MSPYIDRDKRGYLSVGCDPIDVGELTYVLTQAADRYLSRHELRYRAIAEVIGALECTKLEVYRRIGGSYEDAKLLQHGDVFKTQPRPRQTQ